MMPRTDELRLSRGIDTLVSNTRSSPDSGKGLLSRLQGYFSASYGGRYVECIIKEAIEERPRLAQRLFGASKNDVVQVEHRFKVGTRARIADLAFINSSSQRPTALVEIKYDDHRNPKNAAQLTDYARVAKRFDCNFIFLTQHLPDRRLRCEIGNVGQLILFSDLARELKGADDTIAGLLRRFFIDRGLVMHEFQSADVANLKSFLFRLLNPRIGHGRSQNYAAMSGGAAEAFGNLLRNMNIVAKEVVANAHGRTPTIDFWLDPWVDPKKVSKFAKDERDPDSVSASSAKQGGHIFVFGTVRLDDQAGRCYVEFGFGLEVLPKDKGLYPFTYAFVGGGGFKKNETVYVDKPASLRILQDKARAVDALRQRIRQAIDRVITRERPKRQLRKLRAFRNRLDA